MCTGPRGVGDSRNSGLAATWNHMTGIGTGSRVEICAFCHSSRKFEGMSIQGCPMCGEWVGDLRPPSNPLAVCGAAFSLQLLEV
jgi:hypothetical protein